MSIVLLNKLPQDVLQLSDLDSFKQAVSNSHIPSLKSEILFLSWFYPGFKHLINTI